jgi:hypothetical protein
MDLSTCVRRRANTERAEKWVEGSSGRIVPLLLRILVRGPRSIPGCLNSVETVGWGRSSHVADKTKAPGPGEREGVWIRMVGPPNVR